MNPKSPGAKDEMEDDHLPHNRPKSPEHNLVKAGAGAGAEAVSPVGDKEKVSKEGTESASKASQDMKGKEKETPAKDASPLPADSNSSQQKQEAVQSDKTAAPVMSPVPVPVPALASAHSPPPAEPEATESRSLSRPKSRSSFVNMLYSTASAAAAATSSVASSVSTAATATVHSISNKSPMKSRPPSASGETSTLGRFLSPSRNAPTGSSKKGGVNTSAKMTSSAKVKKDTKYDLNVHKSKLLVRDERQIVRRPVKPQLTREDRKIMDLILSGNENVRRSDLHVLLFSYPCVLSV